MKIDPTAHKDIIEAYAIDLWSMEEIAKMVGVSKHAIWKLLRKHGVNTSKHKITVSCTVCGAPIERTRKRVRNQLNHFCNTDCYSAFLDAGKTSYANSGNSSRAARSIVSQWFELKEGNVVHHEDRNRFNNSRYNLRVFANQGDHIRYHHKTRDENHNKITSPHRAMQARYGLGFDVEPIWNGADLNQ